MPLDLGRFRALTFDVVGTLIDFEAGILDCVRTVAGRDLAEEHVLKAFAEEEDVQQQRTPELPFTQMLDPISARLAVRLDLPELAPRAGTGPLRESVPRWPAFPDAPEALAALAGRYRLVALTNADNWATEVMANTLGNPFDDTVTAEDVGVNKPDPRVFAYCLGRQSTYGITSADVLHVAQSQYHDIGVAMGLGLATCWVERRLGRDGYGATPAPATVVAPDLHVGTLHHLAKAANVPVDRIEG